MSLHFGLSDYGRMRFMLEMAGELKLKKKFETIIGEETEKMEKYQKENQSTHLKEIEQCQREIDKNQKEVDKTQIKAKEILSEMEKYAQKNKSGGVVAYAQFQSMNGRDKYFKAIKGTNWCARVCGKRHDHKYLKKKWPDVKKGPEPTVIIWQNL